MSAVAKTESQRHSAKIQLENQPDPLEFKGKITQRLGKNYTLHFSTPLQPIKTWCAAYHVIFSMPEITSEVSKKQFQQIIKSVDTYRQLMIPVYLITTNVPKELHEWAFTHDSQEKVITIADYLGEIACSWGVAILRDGQIVWPRGVFFIGDGMLLNKTIESSPEECTTTTPEHFLKGIEPQLTTYGLA